MLSAHAPSKLPPAALFIVRHHSCYAIHSAGAYAALFDESDRALLPWLRCVVCECLGTGLRAKSVLAASPPTHKKTPTPPSANNNSAFQKCDLYSKTADALDVAALKPYYVGLIEKYGLGGKLRW